MRPAWMSRLGSTAALLAIAYGLSAAANFLLSLVVGRGAGAAALGDFALAVATARTLYAATDLGVAVHLTRVLARDPDATSEHVSLFVALRVLLTCAVATCAFAVGMTEGRTQPVLFITIAAALGAITVQGVFEAALLGHRAQRTVAALTIVSAAAVSASALGWSVAKAPLSVFGTMYFAAAALATAAWLAVTRSRLHVRIAHRVRWSILNETLPRSWPIGASVLLGIGSLRLPILLLGQYVPRQDVGTFAAVDTVVTAVAVVQVAVSNSTMPVLAKAYLSDRARFRRELIRSNVVLAAIGAAAGLGLQTLGAPILAWLFPSKDFSGVVPLLPIVGWSAPALLLVQHNMYVCAAADKERLNLKLMVTWFAAIAVSELVLVPRLGVLGAAWGVLVGRWVGLMIAGVAMYIALREPVDNV